MDMCVFCNKKFYGSIHRYTVDESSKKVSFYFNMGFVEQLDEFCNAIATHREVLIDYYDSYNAMHVYIGGIDKAVMSLDHHADDVTYMVKLTCCYKTLQIHPGRPLERYKYILSKTLEELLFEEEDNND